MNKKIIIILVLCLSIIFIVATVSLAAQNNWVNFEKREGVLWFQDGVTTTIPGVKEKKEIIDSIDPATGVPTKKHDDFFTETEKITMKVMTHNDREKELDFHVIYKGDEPVLIQSNDVAYILTNWPNSDATIMEYDHNLYSVDVRKNKIEPLLAEKVGKYDKNELDKIYVAGYVWATRASVSPDGNRLIYFTTRNLLYDDNFNGQMWLKDFETGEEELLIDNSYFVIGWGEDNEVYARHGFAVEKIDLKTKETEVIVDSMLSEGFSYPYLIYQEDYGQLTVVNLKTNERKDLKFDSLNRISPIYYMEGNPWVLAFNAPDRQKLDLEVVLINVRTDEIKVLPEPPNASFKGAQLISDTQFLVNTRIKGTGVEQSYIINISEVE
jgi:hypothetical protein